ncbi:hypothetical protein SP40_84 [Salmonella phage 40]|nr:hypothetical protein SP40_84 [Salmonella phage 40]
MVVLFFHSEDEVVFQSKERVVTIESDNSGFAAFMSRKDMNGLLDQVKYICEVNNIDLEFPVEIAGEWAGRGIQKGVAISEVEPFFAIFRVAVGKKENGLKWLPPSAIFGLTGMPEDRIYNILAFRYFYLDIPFNEPELVQQILVDITHKVEAECLLGSIWYLWGW